MSRILSIGIFIKQRGEKKLVCEICRHYFCVPACPSFIGRSAELGRYLFRCAGCGVKIYEHDAYVINYGKPYCLECMHLDKDNGEVEN